MSGPESYDWNTHRRNLEKRIKMQRREISRLWAVEQVHWQFVHKVREERSRTPDPAQIRADALQELCDDLLHLGDDLTYFPALAEHNLHIKAYDIRSRLFALIATPLSPPAVDNSESYQSRVKPWLDACFGPEIASDKTERNHRFLEEALELVQSGGCTASEAHQLVDYVYGRPIGEMGQEIGGVMNTLAALCLANGFDMHSAGEIELTRVWTMVEKIRAKHAAKPKHSPLPVAVDNSPAPDAGGKDEAQ